LLSSVVGSLLRRLPSRWKSTLRRLRARLDPVKGIFEYYFRPGVRDPFGGPFNAQRGRQNIFLELVQVANPNAIVETGTFRGTTTEFMAAKSRLPVYTVEVHPQFYHFAKLRLRAQRLVRVSRGDSRSFIRQLTKDASVPKENVFFYLDAHWGADLPLREEVEMIAGAWKRFAIMIDDFEVPDDPGYAFDDYGIGRRLCLEYLPDLSSLGLVAFFPSLSSEAETGARRGSVVLADAPSAQRLLEVGSLREYRGGSAMR
jgi:hypothetical protein